MPSAVNQLLHAKPTAISTYYFVLYSEFMILILLVLEFVIAGLSLTEKIM